MVQEFLYLFDTYNISSKWCNYNKAILASGNKNKTKKEWQRVNKEDSELN